MKGMKAMKAPKVMKSANQQKPMKVLKVMRATKPKVMKATTPKVMKAKLTKATSKREVMKMKSAEDSEHAELDPEVELWTFRRFLEDQLDFSDSDNVDDSQPELPVVG